MKKEFLPILLLLHFQHGLAQNNPNTIITSYNTGTSFSCIAVDTSHKVWAGTNKKGLFRLGNPSSGFELVNTTPSTGDIYDVSKFTIQTLAADKLNNLWVGHSGNAGIASTFGGIDVFNTNSATHVKHIQAETNAECRGDYIRHDGLATYNTQSIAVDDYNTICTANDYTRFLGNTPQEAVTPGALSYKKINQALFTTKSTWNDLINGKEAPELPLPAFTCLAKTRTEDLGGIAGYRTCKSVACGKAEVWVSVYAYKYATSRGLKQIDLTTYSNKYALTTANAPAKLVVYDLNGIYKKTVTFSDLGITANGVFNAVCVTPNENVWVGLSPRLGFAARINGCWKVLNSTNLPEVFPQDANVNPNAIWTNKQGKVFIGTTKGLIVFNGTGDLYDPTSYELYTTATSNISSDNILGGANDRDTVQWVATDNGINSIKSTVGYSLQEDYTHCKNDHINAIEKQLKTDLYDRGDFHSYVVETTICEKASPDDLGCTAQAVYDVMKSNIAYQAPSPQVFSHDNMKLSMLALLTDEEKNEIISNINAWTEDKATYSPYSGISEIRQILPISMILKYYCTTGSCFGDGQLPFFRLLYDSELEGQGIKQTQANGKNMEVESCTKEYKLYNSTNHISDRKLFSFADYLFCNNKLLNVEYDPVRIYADRKNLTITNYTMEGHFLDPGKVKRFVVEECDKVKVVTVGTGLNYCADEAGAIPNAILSAEAIAYFYFHYGLKYGTIGPDGMLSAVQQKAFKALAKQFAKQNGNGNLVQGAIMFKNVDFLLRKGFAE